MMSSQGRSSSWTARTGPALGTAGKARNFHPLEACSIACTRKHSISSWHMWRGQLQGQQQQAASAMAIKLSDPGTRASLAQRGTLGRRLAIVDRSLGHGATALNTGETSFLSIERMRVPRHLIEDIRGLGQVARDCPAWLEEMVGNEASRGAVARNTLHFLWMEIHKARKGQPRNIASLVKPKVLEDVSMTLGALLPLCHPEDVDAWLPPACKIAAHLDEHGIGIVLGKIPGTLDQVSDSSEMAQTGLTALRRSSLASIAGQGDEHTSRSRRKI